MVEFFRLLRHGALDPPHVVVGLVPELPSLAAFPEIGQGKFQEGQIPRLLADVVQEALHQPRLKGEPNFCGRLLYGLGQLLPGHGPESDHGLLQAVGQGPVTQGLPEEIPPEGEDHRQGRVLGGLEDFVQEAPPAVLVPGQGVELLPLVRHQEQAVGAGLFGQDPGHHIPEGQVAGLEVGGQLVDLGQPVHFGHLRLQQGQKGGGQGLERPVPRQEGYRFPYQPTPLLGAQAGNEAGPGHGGLAAARRPPPGPPGSAGRRPGSIGQ